MFKANQVDTDGNGNYFVPLSPVPPVPAVPLQLLRDTGDARDTREGDDQ